jgi:hypothetical protein
MKGESISNRTRDIVASGRESHPRTWLGRWFLGAGGAHEGQHPQTHPWYLVLWLTGVDYFSTLGYQPGIALLAAGALSPIATGILVGVTLLGALPVYAQVAGRSYAGQGSIAMLESLLPGWFGKLFVLVLLGFAGTDFIITMTLSAADAAQHAIENPFLHPYLGEARVALTLGLLTLLAIVFLRGFMEAIGLAAAVAIPYLLLNLVALIRGAVEIARRPELLDSWHAGLLKDGDWTMALIASGIIFPKLALGMSGFETGVSVMPLVSGATVRERVRATRFLLISAAAIMSVYLLLSSIVTTALIPEAAFKEGGAASGRAIAYLAHEYLGSVFGTIYDVSTILILWFAGASAMAGLLNLVPRYLPRFGMAPQWVSHHRPLVTILFAIAAIVTLLFQADVEAQAGAYATGVLVLMLSAAAATALALWRELRRPAAIYFWIVTAVFAFALGDNIVERPDGVIIAAIFIVTILIVSAISRYMRSTEMRATGVTFVDDESAALWAELSPKRISLVPLATNTPAARARKAAEVRRHYAPAGRLGFIHVKLLDNRSEFVAPLQATIRREGENVVIEITGAIAIANTIAYVSELIDPISIFLGLTRQNLMTQSLRFFLWGEGETGLLVYTILLKYWEETPEDDVRPLIFLMSE